MPALSLVVCVHLQRDLLERLLRQSAGCYDDLVVVHDGPDASGARSVVEAAGGRFFERPRQFTHESHWPFAWQECRHDWILLFDTDEFPSDELRSWLVAFRHAPEPDRVSGYRCIWPLWNGVKAVSRRWPSGRLFLIDRRSIRYFGMGEQRPIPDLRYVDLPYILCHQPLRRSYGIRNIIFRKSARHWQTRIATSLLGTPLDLPLWRWSSNVWPEDWEQLRRHPLRTGLYRQIRWPLRSLRDQWKLEKRFFPTAALTGPLHHLMIGLAYWRLRRKSRSGSAKT